MDGKAVTNPKKGWTQGELKPILLNKPH